MLDMSYSITTMAEPIAVDPRLKSDEIIQKINKKFISLDKNEKRICNEHLETVLDLFINQMNDVDSMFKACYQTTAYVGSSYEGLKVGKPEEFDLNVIIKLPVNYSCLTHEVAVERPGYVKIKADADVLPNLMKHNRWKDYKIMRFWFDENSYLNQNEFRYWFESVVIQAYNRCNDETNFTLSHKKSGPALTLKINVPGGHIIDVDLVPVLEFTTQLPKPFIDRNTKCRNWFTIPKPLEGFNNHSLWRPSFYEREREILKGSSKPAIRLMKKLRDTQKFGEIASYYIKTLFLWELEERELHFQKLSVTSLFIYMLNRLQKACANHEILDFWNRENNLLSKINLPRMADINFRLKRIIYDINRKISDDPYVIAEFILTGVELEQLKQSVIISEMVSMSLKSGTEAILKSHYNQQEIDTFSTNVKEIATTIWRLYEGEDEDSDYIRKRRIVLPSEQENSDTSASSCSIS